jgi:hypothetical protein
MAILAMRLYFFDFEGGGHPAFNQSLKALVSQLRRPGYRQRGSVFVLDGVSTLPTGRLIFHTCVKRLAVSCRCIKQLQSSPKPLKN